MDFQCKEIVARVIPTFRSLLAKALIDKYGYTQTQAASKIGVTQAAISHYLNSKRAKKGRKTLGIDYALLESIARETAEKIVADEIKPDEITIYFCKFCNSFKESSAIK
jgi:predicted transcriptional regulator